MSQIIDFHFSLPKVAADSSWLSKIDSALRTAGLQRLAVIQPLFVDEDGELDVIFPYLQAASWFEVRVCAAQYLGVSLNYASAELDLMLLAWKDVHIGVVVTAPLNMWLLAKLKDRVRIGGLLASLSEILKSSFGVSAVNSKILPSNELTLPLLLGSIEHGESLPELFWLHRSLIDMDILKKQVGVRGEVFESTAGYYVVVTGPAGLWRDCV